MSEQLPAGWAKPATSRTFHYFPKEELRSLCGRWMYGGAQERADDLHDHPENCKTCRTKRDKLWPAQAAGEGA